MGALKDIIDAIKELKVSELVAKNLKKKKYSSIAKRADEGILQIPTIVTDATDFETAHMVNKAIERNYASFIMTAISMNPAVNINRTPDAGVAEYLKQFHQNSDYEIRRDKYYNWNKVEPYFENFSDYACFENDEGLQMIFGVYENSSTANIMKQIKFDNEGGYAKYFNPNVLNNMVVDSIRYSNISEAAGKDGSKNNLRTDTLNEIAKNIKHSSGKKMSEDLSKNMMVNQDMNKINELVPTMVHIRLKCMSQGKDGTARVQDYVDCMIGVKAHMHLVKHDDMITHLLEGLKNRSKFFNFIRWTSGEISFFKDFLFNIKEIKANELDKKRGSDEFWYSAKRQKAWSKIANTPFNADERVLPNSTIVVTMDEVDYIKNQYGYDLMNPAQVRRIIDTYFLLGFVVIDSATQICHFLFENKNVYEQITFSGLERENSNDSKKFKEMLKAINRN